MNIKLLDSIIKVFFEVGESQVKRYLLITTIKYILEGDFSCNLLL